MPRKASSVPKKQRTPKASAGFSDTPRIMSDEEKHRMIMAHVAVRAPQDPLQRVSMWAGVTLSVAVLAVGWWFTVGNGIRQEVTQGSEELRRATAELDKFTNMVETTPFLNAPIGNPTSNASASSFEDLLKENLPEQPNEPRELFAPPSESLNETSTDATSTSSATTPTPTPAPTVPAGLTPDP